MAPFSIILVGEFCVTIYTFYENQNLFVFCDGSLDGHYVGRLLQV